MRVQSNMDQPGDEMKKAEALSRNNSDVNYECSSENQASLDDNSECPSQGPVVLDENVDNAEKLILVSTKKI